ncbi:MAG: hypothetical protein LAO21_08475 [Acidobacteriia bacterium]|nr:hypothetical protein [Terriglobia bacterium]
MKRYLFVLMLFAATTAVAAATQGYVVFLKDSEVYSVRTDGSDLRQLTSDENPKDLPRWSPDGKPIAFMSHPRRDPERAFAHFIVVTKQAELDDLKEMVLRLGGEGRDAWDVWSEQ